MSHLNDITALADRSSDLDWYFRTLGVQRPPDCTADANEWRDYAQTVRNHMILRRRLLREELNDILSPARKKEVCHD